MLMPRVPIPALADTSLHELYTIYNFRQLKSHCIKACFMPFPRNYKKIIGHMTLNTPTLVIRHAVTSRAKYEAISFTHWEGSETPPQNLDGSLTFYVAFWWG